MEPWGKTDQPMLIQISTPLKMFNARYYADDEQRIAISCKPQHPRHPWVPFMDLQPWQAGLYWTHPLQGWGCLHRNPWPDGNILLISRVLSSHNSVRVPTPTPWTWAIALWKGSLGAKFFRFLAVSSHLYSAEWSRENLLMIKTFHQTPYKSHCSGAPELLKSYPEAAPLFTTSVSALLTPRLTLRLTLNHQICLQSKIIIHHPSKASSIKGCPP